MFTSPNHPALVKENGVRTIGMCDNLNKVIYINNQLTGEKLKKVLCHEIVHAAMFSYDIRLNESQEELFADLVATYGQEIIAMTSQLFSRIKEKWGTYN